MDGEISVNAGAQNGICVCPHGLNGVRIGEDSEEGLSDAAKVLEDAERVADLHEGGVQRSRVGRRVGLKRMYNLQQRRVGARQEEPINATVRGHGIAFCCGAMYRCSLMYLSLDPVLCDTTLDECDCW